jgi:hypothetical protein
MGMGLEKHKRTGLAGDRVVLHYILSIATQWEGFLPAGSRTVSVPRSAQQKRDIRL